jgi:trans-2,3-dihydro-3-hydroxyanthranilate isomerase
VCSLDALRRLQPDARALRELDAKGGHVGTHVFALDTFDAGCATHARHFAPSLGIAEDPVTGSATGAMAAYLWRHGILRRLSFTAEQGHLVGRPGIVSVEVEGDSELPTAVRVGGQAVTVLRGTILA